VRFALPTPPADYDQRMPVVPEATRLEVVQKDPSGRVHQLTPPAAAAWVAMRLAAADAGAPLALISAFRSIARQSEIVRAKLKAGAALSSVLTVSAYPGHSEHHSGRALDLGTPDRLKLEERFATTPQFAWLTRHAVRFGFTLSYPRGKAAGVIFEPWHWCYNAESRP
jgi:zinc D-Ala-D-Ala carboxypeptidase